MTERHPSRSEVDLDDRIASLLADPQYEGHPLRDALLEVMERMGQQLLRLERITQISDRYQSGVHEQVLDLSRRYDRQLKKLEKAIRISDRYQVMLNETNKALQLASTHDQLTGLPNRRLMIDCCSREDQRAAREESTYSLLAIDVDHFKSINDTYGHDCGDLVLKALAETFLKGLRAYDTCARWGGEEFMALLASADLAIAERVAQRMLSMVRTVQVEVDGAVIEPRISIGVAEFVPGETYADVYRRADAALYQAKNSGRDRYVLAQPGD
jgi:diguanylate cyclase (GGDEF)-like protein